MGVGGQMTPANLTTAERERQSVDLRCQGLPYEQIAGLVGYANASGPWKACERWLQRVRDELQESAADLLSIELRALNAMQSALWVKAIDEGDPRSVMAILKIMERRARLLGLDAPTQINLSGGATAIRVEQQRAALQAIEGDPESLEMARKLGDRLP